MSKYEKLDLSYYHNLIKKINHYDKKYYIDSDSQISDSEYDKLRAELTIIEAKYPEWKKSDSPSEKVGYLIKEQFAKIAHSKPMLSLNNGFSQDDIEDFINRVKKFLNINYFPKLCVEPKIDGISFVARYEKRKLKQGITRGDGKVGEDITENLKVIKDLPLNLPLSAPEELEVRGEIYLSKADFTKLNKLQENNNDKIFSNPRNAASGSLRQLDTAITAARNLKYYIYSVVNKNFSNSQYDSFIKLEQYGFQVNKLNISCDNFTELMKYYNLISEDRYALPYDIDGMVYKIDDLILQERLGEIARSPRWAIAHKFAAEEAKTKLEDIIIQVGRTGALTPVAVLSPINIGGVVVTRASLHNEDEIIRKELEIGDIVNVKRAGDVIPQIISVDKSKRSNTKKYVFPTHCPICDNIVNKLPGEAVTRCNAEYKCEAQILGRIKHFVSQAGFNIEGLRDKQIEFLYSKNLIRNSFDIFTLEARQKNSITRLENYPGWGKLSVNNLYNSINNARIISLEKFIYALAIKHVGINIASIIAKEYSTFNNMLDNISKALDKDSTEYQELINIDGIGVKIIDAISKYFNYQENIILLKNLASEVEIKPYFSDNIVSKLNDKIIVFTGKLINITRLEAKAKAEKLGAKVASTISSKTDYLIAGEGSGSKYAKAKKLGIKILTEEEWQNLF
jgi:DNA ligase (NAD+)